MNMVQVYIKGQEDKELSSFLRYYPVRIKNIGMDAFFDRQVQGWSKPCRCGEVRGKDACQEVWSQGSQRGFLLRSCKQPGA